MHSICMKMFTMLHDMYILYILYRCLLHLVCRYILTSFGAMIFIVIMIIMIITIILVIIIIIT